MEFYLEMASNIIMFKQYISPYYTPVSMCYKTPSPYSLFNKFYYISCFKFPFIVGLNISRPLVVIFKTLF